MPPAGHGSCELAAGSVHHPPRRVIVQTARILNRPVSHVTAGAAAGPSTASRSRARYEHWIGSERLSFRARDDAQRLGDVVEFHWEMAPSERHISIRRLLRRLGAGLGELDCVAHLGCLV